jgi:hypothetical protein
MTLRDAVVALDLLDDHATLYVERIDGQFQGRSLITVCPPTETVDGDGKSVPAKVLEARYPGRKYFLEVDLIAEILEGWRNNHGGAAPSTDAALESVIYYAENDAYPDSFFGV